MVRSHRRLDVVSKRTRGSLMDVNYVVVASRLYGLHPTGNTRSRREHDLPQERVILAGCNR